MNQFDLSDAVQQARFIAWLSEWNFRCASTVLVELPGNKELDISVCEHREEPS